LNDEDLELHFYTMKIFQNDPTSKSIKAFREYLDKLRKISNANGIFPVTTFAERLEKSWKELFYYLPPFGKEVVNSYRELSGGFNEQQKKYYWRFRMNKFLGRR